MHAKRFEIQKFEEKIEKKVCMTCLTHRDHTKRSVFLLESNGRNKDKQDVCLKDVCFKRRLDSSLLSKEEDPSSIHETKSQ